MTGSQRDQESLREGAWGPLGNSWETFVGGLAEEEHTLRVPGHLSTKKEKQEGEGRVEGTLDTLGGMSR